MKLRRLNLGCGKKPVSGWINIDSRPGDGVDIVRDVLRGLPFDSDSVDAAISSDFLEHIPQPEVVWVMNEIWRVMKSGMIAVHQIPIAGGPVDVGDPTHLSRWNRNSISYFDQVHRHNSYYGGLIKPWLVIKYEDLSPSTFSITLMKPPL